METPTEIAERIVNRENTALIEKNREFWVQRIAQSITVAVGHERERCAKIADEHASIVIGHANCDPSGDALAMAESIAEAIRSNEQ
jgi:hypothetical protein